MNVLQTLLNGGNAQTVALSELASTFSEDLARALTARNGAQVILDTKIQAYESAAQAYKAHKGHADSSITLMSSGVPTNYDGSSLAAAATVLQNAETERNAAQESLELANQLVTDLQQALESTNAQIALLNAPVAAPVVTAPPPPPAHVPATTGWRGVMNSIGFFGSNW